METAGEIFVSLKNHARATGRGVAYTDNMGFAIHELPSGRESFSPDASHIVFTSDRHGSADLFRVKADGTGIERLTDSPSYDDQAAFSPDGKQLVFVTTRGGGTANLWTMDVQTRRAKALTAGPGGDFGDAAAMDGRDAVTPACPGCRAFDRTDSYSDRQSSITVLHPSCPHSHKKPVGLSRLTRPSNKERVIAYSTVPVPS